MQQILFNFILAMIKVSLSLTNQETNWIIPGCLHIVKYALWVNILWNWFIKTIPASSQHKEAALTPKKCWISDVQHARKLVKQDLVHFSISKNQLVESLNAWIFHSSANSVLTSYNFKNTVIMLRLLRPSSVKLSRIFEYKESHETAAKELLKQWKYIWAFYAATSPPKQIKHSNLEK